MKKNAFECFVVSFLPVIAVAVLGAIFVSLGREWFECLKRPSEFLPTFVFPIVWTAIYLIAGSILYQTCPCRELSRATKNLFAVNGLLNVAWCAVFFGLNMLFFGLVIIVINAVFSYLLVIFLRRDCATCSRIFFIYPLWLTLATFLNLAVWILN